VEDISHKRPQPAIFHFVFFIFQLPSAQPIPPAKWKMKTEKSYMENPFFPLS
jgi:hypothetical protein